MINHTTSNHNPNNPNHNHDRNHNSSTFSKGHSIISLPELAAAYGANTTSSGSIVIKSLNSFAKTVSSNSLSLHIKGGSGGTDHNINVINSSDNLNAVGSIDSGNDNNDSNHINININNNHNNNVDIDNNNS